MDGFDPTEIVACALRPTGSLRHLIVLLGFVTLAWWVSPKRPGRVRATSS
jgi:hypothetical protein